MRSRTTQILTLAIIAISTFLSVPAQAAPKKMFDTLFEKLDTNRDKQLSEGEFLGKKKGEAKARALRDFRELDKDNNKSLLFKEYKRL